MSIFLPTRRFLGGASWAKNALWARARAVPSLDLRFADNTSLTDATTGQNLVTFTRASSGTYVGSDGVLRTAVTNLCTYSEQFNDITWTKLNITIASNAITAPDGTLSADLIVESAAVGAERNVNKSINAGSTGQVTKTIYVKAAGRYKVYAIGQSGVFYACYNLNTLTTFDVSGCTASISDVGNEWRRLILTANATTSFRFDVGLLPDSATSISDRFYNGNGTSGIYIWGAQLEQSSTVGEYIPTTSTINSAPRFDHNPTTGESLGLLVEEQRTNGIRNNTMVGAVAGTPGTLPTNWTIGGSGVGTLSRTITVGESAGISWIDIRHFGTTSTTGFILAFEPSTQIAALTGQSWASSFYLALVNGSIANINTLRHDIVERTSAGGTVAQNFSADFKSALTSTLTRFTYAVALNGGATTAFAQPSIEFNFASGVAIDITLRIGLPQLEQGAFATSVIPTTTTALTRSADVASITGTNFSSWYRQDEGTVFGEGSVLNNGANRFLAGINDGTVNEEIGLYWNASFNSLANDNGASQGNSFGSSVTANSRMLHAFGYKLNDMRGYGNATALNAITSATVPTTNRMNIGRRDDFSFWFNGTIRRLTYWPQRLPNSTLQTITQ